MLLLQGSLSLSRNGGGGDLGRQQEGAALRGMAAALALEPSPDTRAVCPVNPAARRRLLRVSALGQSGQLGPRGVSGGQAPKVDIRPFHAAVWLQDSESHRGVSGVDGTLPGGVGLAGSVCPVGSLLGRCVPERTGPPQLPVSRAR